MRRRTPLHPVTAGLLIALAGSLPATAVLGQDGSPAPLDAVTLVDQRAIEVPDGRIVSMSPDGRWLAHARPDSLCVVSVDTLAEQACADLSGLGAGLRLEDVTWAPDGSALAFSENALRILRDGDLWHMDALTGALTNLDDDGVEGRLDLSPDDTRDAPITIPLNPAFSPDGSRIAFSRSVVEPDGSRRTAIAVVPATGGEVTEVEVIDDELGVVYFGIRWSPDGERLYLSFTAQDREDLRNGIWVMRADGSGSPSLVVPRYQDTPGPAVVGVTADGGTLLLQDPTVLALFGGRDLSAWALADVATGEVEPLVAMGEAPAGAFVSLAGLSPDGRSVVLLQSEGRRENRVYVRPVDGDAATLLVPEAIEDAGPIDRLLPITWATNDTLFLTGGGAFEQGTVLTVTGGQRED
jgi:hypothetical protein